MLSESKLLESLQVPLHNETAWSYITIRQLIRKERTFIDFMELKTLAHGGVFAESLVDHFKQEFYFNAIMPYESSNQPLPPQGWYTLPRGQVVK